MQAARQPTVDGEPAACSDLAVAMDGQILGLHEADEYGRLRLARFGVGWVRGEA